MIFIILLQALIIITDSKWIQTAESLSENVLEKKNLKMIVPVAWQ